MHNFIMNIFIITLENKPHDAPINRMKYSCYSFKQIVIGHFAAEISPPLSAAQEISPR